MKKYLKNLFLNSVLCFVAIGCANVVAPSGGLKDTEAPKLLKGTPENFSVHFLTKKVRLDFNEYIQLKDISRELIISPPLKETPEFILKNKSVFFEIEDTLLPNTTYTFNFGKAISDITEGNIAN